MVFQVLQAVRAFDPIHRPISAPPAPESGLEYQAPRAGPSMIYGDWMGIEWWYFMGVNHH